MKALKAANVPWRDDEHLFVISSPNHVHRSVRAGKFDAAIADKLCHRVPDIASSLSHFYEKSPSQSYLRRWE